MDRDIALGIVRELYGKQLFSVRKALSELIPELTESEDERIRKEIIKYLEQTVPHHHRDEVLKSKEWIAWLEKQKSQEEQQKWEDYAYRKGLRDGAKAIEKQIEYKPAEWSEEDEKHINTLISHLEGCKEDVKTQWDARFLDKEIDWIKSLRPQKQWKPSPKQREALKEAIFEAECSHSDGLRAALESLCNDLDKL